MTVLYSSKSHAGWIEDDAYRKIKKKTLKFEEEKVARIFNCSRKGGKGQKCLARKLLTEPKRRIISYSKKSENNVVTVVFQGKHTCAVEEEEEVEELQTASQVPIDQPARPPTFLNTNYVYLLFRIYH